MSEGQTSNKLEAESAPCNAACYALHWRYSDGSSSGVVPHLFTEAEKAVVSQVFEEIEPCKDVEWVLLHNSHT